MRISSWEILIQNISNGFLSPQHATALRNEPLILSLFYLSVRKSHILLEPVTIQPGLLSECLDKNSKKYQDKCFCNRVEKEILMASLIPISNSTANIRGSYMVVSPEGAGIEIPKELFVVLCDFLQIRKDAGSMI